MKFTAFVLFTSLLFGSVTAQETLPERQKRRTKEKATQRLEDKIENGVDKGLDKIDEKLSGIGKKKKKRCGKKESEEETAENSTNNSGSNETNQENNSSTSNEGGNGSTGGTTTGSSGTNPPASSGSTNPEFKRFSKFDFVSGEKVIAFDDFSDANVGDFPLEWNTNSSGEIVTVDNTNQKWLFMSQDGFFQPEYVKEMPDNFTLEFDVFTRYRSSNIVRYGMYFAATENPRSSMSEKHLSDMIEFTWSACKSQISYFVTEAGEVVNSNDGLSSEALACSGDSFEEPAIVHFSIWRQKNRLRIYVDEQKIIDIPQAFNPSQTYNLFKFGSQYMNFATADQADEFMVTNMRYAVGAPDTRSKLITEGKLVSRGILFDVNSDKLKAESYGALKEVAQALKENPDVRIKIVGHTDADGDDAANLELSKKRAASVKLALTTEFGIDASRMETDGMGETQPTDPNTTAAGKANNRRVEFIKL